MSAPRHPRTGSVPGSGSSFTVDIDLVGRIRLVGVLDRCSVPLFQEAISALLLVNHDAWLLDTTDLTGCDQIGVWAIGAAYRRTLRHNRRMTLTGAPRLLQHPPGLMRDGLRVLPNLAPGEALLPRCSRELVGDEGGRGIMKMR
jgi:anti-anti-sigma regulatory factor